MRRRHPLALVLMLALPLGPRALAPVARAQPTESVPLPELPADTPAADSARLERVSLSVAIERALRRSPSLAVAAADARRAAALVEQVRAAALPTLSVNATYTRLDDDRRLDTQVFVPANQVAANAMLTVPLLAPARWTAWARSRDERQLAELSAAETRRQVVLTTAHAYLTVVTQHRAVEAAARARALAQVHRERAQKRLGGGVGSQLDEVRALQALREEEQRLERAAGLLWRAQGALGALLGDGRPIDVSEEPALAEPLPVAEARAAALRARPDLRMLALRLETAKRSVRDSFTDYLPVVTGVFMPMYQRPASLIQPELSWQLQLQLTVPIYDGGLRYGLLHERQARRDAAAASLSGTLAATDAELAAGAAELRHAGRSVELAREAAALARRAVETAALSFRLGATTSLDYLDAQRRARDSEYAALVAEDELRRVRLDQLARAGQLP
ncbi:MAG: TolC family protein [Polyangia bacterium]